MYISDLDGTLLRKDLSISKYTKEVINEYIKNDGFFTIATARSLYSTEKLIKDLNLNRPMILLNGVFIYNPLSKEYLVKNILDSDDLYELLKIYKKHKIDPLIFGQKNNEQKVFFKEFGNSYKNKFVSDKIENNDKRFNLVESYPDFTKWEINHLSVMDSYDRLYNLKEEIRRKNKYEVHFYEDVYQKGGYLLEVAHKKASKYEALMWVKKNMKTETVTAFGDNINDIGLMKAADKRVAVSNAKEELKKICDTFIGSNEEDSVAKYIEENEKDFFKRY